jgi:hypothetical protein
MNLVPKNLSRLGYRSLLKFNAKSPTILVIAGVVGLGATAVLASRASRKVDPIIDKHKKARAEIGIIANDRARQLELGHLYRKTGVELGKLYGPTLFVGMTSAISVLGGHNILRGRQIATMAAYSGLIEQFSGYRKRVAQTLGDDVERGLYEGARGEWEEDPEHRGEYKLQPKYDVDNQSYLRPWFDQTNYNWTRDALSNYLFLKGVQSHMNNLLQIRGHVFLNEVFDALAMPRCKEGQVQGWLYNSPKGDNIVDFGFMTSNDPQTVAFRNHVENIVKLNFNVDEGIIWNLI